VAKIRVKYRGATYEFNTPQEAAETMTLLEAKERERRAWREMALSGMSGPLEQHLARLSPDLTEAPEPIWTPRTFDTFIERLGDSQKAALSLLVRKSRATDSELVSELRLTGNQALAGTLSGISKQAALLDIEAREVFRIENQRKARKRSNVYFVSDSFQKAALAMNWPPAPPEK
jgi:hypothetical protein